MDVNSLFLTQTQSFCVSHFINEQLYEWHNGESKPLRVTLRLVQPQMLHVANSDICDNHSPRSLHRLHQEYSIISQIILRAINSDFILEGHFILYNFTILLMYNAAS